MFTLRPYQKQAVDAVYDYLRNKDGNPCVVIPTGGGKTHVLSQICRDAVDLWDGRVLIVTHVKELVEQNAGKVMAYLDQDLVGIYSAGLKRRDTDHPVIAASIQSIYKRACELGPFDLVIIDEAHMLPPSGEGMYRTFLKDAHVVSPHLRVIGLTATPYRMSTGMICGPENILNEICFEAGVKELIVAGYLCPLKSKAGKRKVDTSALHLRGGEFISGEVEKLMDDESLVYSACNEIIEQTKDRNHVLIFAAGIDHARHVKRVLASKSGMEVEMVTGQTPSGRRDEILARFKGQSVKSDLFGSEKGPIKYLVNVNVLTTGFDAPNIDCVVLLRPTMSPGLYYQMCLDMETEVLTRSGWRYCHEVAKGDEVAAFDLETEEIEYVPAQDKVHRALRPHESMYGIRAPHLDIRLTNLHKLVVRSKSQSTLYWSLQTAQEAANRRETYLIPIAGNGNNYRKEAPLSDAQVAFLGWFLMDGYHNRLNNTINISQSTVKYIQEIRSVLNACNFGFREYPVHRNGKLSKYEKGLLFVIPYGTPRGINSGKNGWLKLEQWIDKDVPAIYNSLSVRQFRILLSAMNLANGKRPSRLSYQKKTMDISVGCRQRLADRIQQLAVERGFRCNIQTFTPMPNDWNANPQTQWILHVRDQKRAYIGGTSQYPNKLIPNRCQLGPVSYEQNEWVWCLTTEKGTLVTRRKGKIAVVGNCGRGFRLHPSKEDCLVLDFGGNILRHGPVDDLQIKDKSNSSDGQAPARECPECHLVVHAAYAICPECGFEFPKPQSNKHEASATTAGILTGQSEDIEYEVKSVSYIYHIKRNAGPDDKPTMRVEYQVGFNEWISEWICFEHTGYARSKAEHWWRQRSDEPVPETIDEAVTLANNGALAESTNITVRKVTGRKFDRIIDYVLGPRPKVYDDSAERDDSELPDYVFTDDGDIPF